MSTTAGEATRTSFFTGDLDASFVLVHLNPKQRDVTSDEPADFPLPFRSFEEYFDVCRHFGARMYGSESSRTHRSQFDLKQVRFLEPFDVIDFVEEKTREDRFTNLERLFDCKLQLELIPYGSNSFSAWGEIFGDDATAAAMIDRLVHHAEILSLKGDSYRLKDHDLGVRPTPQGAETA